MSRRQSVVLSRAEKCELGRGEYGAVCSHRGTNGKLYAVKIPIKGASTKELKREREMHFAFYNKVADNMKKHFPKPVDVKWEGGENRIDPSVYAMEEVVGGIVVVDIFTDRKKYAKFNPERLLRQLRRVVISMWKAGFIHSDLHLNNMVVDKNGTLVVLDFGFMGKVLIKPPSTHNGDPEQRLDDKWVDWFEWEWSAQLDRLELQVANPNIVAWPRQMTVPYFAGSHENMIRKPAKAIGKRQANKLTPTPSMKLKSPPPPPSMKAKTPPKVKKTVVQLKASLRARALPVTGCKQVLQNRLNARIAANKLIPTPRITLAPRKARTPSLKIPPKMTALQLKAELVVRKRNLRACLFKCMGSREEARIAVNKILPTPRSTPTPQKAKTPPKKRTVAQLKAELKKRGLRLGGAKKNLQNRLNASSAARKPAPKV